MIYLEFELIINKKSKKKELATSYFRTTYYLRRDDA